MIANRASGLVLRAWDRRRSTYADDPAPGVLGCRLPPLPLPLLEPRRAAILEQAALFVRRRFDLLGSGWVPVETPSGGIDWHVDFKNGTRWDPATWYRDIPYGHVLGADVKVPWELGRLQHLPILAFAHALDPQGGFDRAFQTQVSDFHAANPPRFGVQWRCTMDVAIRAANLALAWDLFAAAGAVFDAGFASAMTRMLLEHCRHIAANLEWYPEGRGNHYLADIAGLAVAAAALPSTSETAAWLDLAERELWAETALQFLPDGANFEASTAYHRLSAELVLFATAVLAGLGRVVPDAHRARLAAMAAFSRGIVKPSGLIPQIGDNDSGRFFKLDHDAPDLDHRALTAAVDALLSGTMDDGLDAWVVAGLAGRTLPAPPPPPIPVPPPFADPGDRVPLLGRTVIEPGGSSLRDHLTLRAWPDFGLYLWRSDRLYLAVRCGPIGQNGRGGHAHNDQLAIELSIDGEDWLRDPGSYLYTADPALRNRYRGVAAHAAPRFENREPGGLDLGLFWLGDEARARCLAFGPHGFAGDHIGFGAPLRRRVMIEDQRILITDSGLPGPGDTVVCRTADEVRARLGGDVAFSPGYGCLTLPRAAAGV